jgi:hypothetical protein
LAGTLLFDEKIRQSVALFVWDYGMLEFLPLFFPQAVIQRTTVDFPAFLETGFCGKDSVCVHITLVLNKKED